MHPDSDCEFVSGPWPGLGPTSRGVDFRSLNNTTNSLGPPRLQRSTTIINEPYIHSTSASVHAMMAQEQGANLMYAQKKSKLYPSASDVQEQQGLRQIRIQTPLPQWLVQQRLQQQQIKHVLLDTMHTLVPLQPGPSTSDSGPCAQQLEIYMNHQRQRPPDNSILYWKEIVTRYFSPLAKKRYCLSRYNDVGSHAGAFPQAAMVTWKCDICGSTSGKGFEAAYEVLPRLCQIKFDCGVVDELLSLEAPCERRLSSGIWLLESAKALEVSVYEQLRVFREGHLRIAFTTDLKILSWEFCAWRHEEHFPRRAVAPQASQLQQVADKYQTTVNESGSAGLSVQDLQGICNMFVAATHQLARNMELQSLNELGFPKRYVRSMQVVNIMKDLMDFTLDNKIGPKESLKIYPWVQNARDTEQVPPAQTLPGSGSDTINDRITDDDASPASAAPNGYQNFQSTSADQILQDFQEFNNKRRGTNDNVVTEEAGAGCGPSGSGVLPEPSSGGPVCSPTGAEPSGSNGVRSAANNSSPNGICNGRTDQLPHLNILELDQAILDGCAEVFTGGRQ